MSSTLMWVLLAAFVLLYCGMFGLRPLMTPDEGRYAEISREMLLSGDWVTPRLNGYLYFEKPPLQYWATALSFAVFGIHEWSARLWSGLMYLASGAAIGWCGLRLYGRGTAFLATLAYFAMALPFVLGQVETLDSGVAAFMTVALCAFCVSQRQDARAGRGAMLVCWTAMAGAVLSKGLIGIVLPGVTLALYVLVTQQWRVLTRMQWAAGLALFAVLVVPWFVLVSMRNPGFAQFFFVHEHFQRFLTTVHERVEPWWYFIVVLALGLLPWTTRAVGAFVEVLSGRTEGGREQGTALRVLLLFVIWSLFVTFFFSLSQSKLMPYVLPVFPAVALVLARSVDRDPDRGFRLTVVVAAILWAALFIASFVSGPKLQTRFDALETAWILRWARVGCVLALVLAAFSWRLFSRARARTPAQGLLAWQTLAVAQIAGIFLLTLAATPYGASRSSVRYIASAPESFSSASDVYSIGEFDQSLMFYLRRRITLVEFVNEFEYGMTADPSRASLTLDAFRARWLAAAHPVAVIERDRIPEVEALGLPARIVYRDRRGAVMIPD